MRRSLWSLIGVLAVIGVLSVSFLVPPARAASSFVDIEPNDTCAGAQDLGALDAPLTVTGGLDGLSVSYPGPIQPGELPNLDFFRVSATPGDFVQIDLAGLISGQGTLAQPFVGVFNSDCFQIAQAISDGFSNDARVVVEVPADGSMVIAASSCCDFTFTFGGSGAGTYTLTVSQAPLIGSISGQLVDALTGSPISPATSAFATVQLQGCDALEPTFCNFYQDLTVDGDGRFRFDTATVGFALGSGFFRVAAQADGYRALATPVFFVDVGQDLDLGALQMSPPQPIGSIGGRVVDARSGAPVAGASISLSRCDDPFGCFSVAFVGSDTDGSFAFSTASLGFPLFDGDYQLDISAPNYDPTATGRFSVAAGADYAVGDVALSPIVQIGSISGRLVDAVTGQPLTSDATLFSYASLLQCDDFGNCFNTVGLASPDANGFFRFDASSAFFTLRPGTYAISYFAEQYVSGQTAPFVVGEGENFSAGDIAVQPFPVRLLDGVSCNSIPARGGTCTYSLRVVNGQNKAASFQAWSTVTASSPSSPLSTFQPQGAQKVRLKPGETREVRFSFDVPRNVAPNTSICTQFYVANDARGFYFAPVNQRFGFCVTKDGAGDFTQVSGEQERELRQRMNGLPEGQRGRR